MQTNYDHWDPVPTADDRRHPAIKLMDEMGQKSLSEGGMWRVIRTWPVSAAYSGTLLTLLIEMCAGI